MAKRTLPDFADPPAVETVLGVGFAPLHAWGIPHFGLYWAKIRGEFSHFQVQPPILNAPGVPLGLGANPVSTVEFAPAPHVRCWFFNGARSRIIQVQRDRFMQNWIKTSAEQAYEHYDLVSPQFAARWEGFLAFLDEAGVGRPKDIRVEVTYVNHLERGREWGGFNDLPSVLPLWSGKGSTGFLPSPDAVALNARYPISESGALAVIAEPAIRAADGKAIIQLRLTASVQPATNDTAAITAAMDEGHRWIVEGFTDFTSKSMHQLWNRTV